MKIRVSCSHIIIYSRRWNVSAIANSEVYRRDYLHDRASYLEMGEDDIKHVLKIMIEAEALGLLPIAWI